MTVTWAEPEMDIGCTGCVTADIEGEDWFAVSQKTDLMDTCNHHDSNQDPWDKSSGLALHTVQLLD